MVPTGWELPKGTFQEGKNNRENKTYFLDLHKQLLCLSLLLKKESVGLTNYKNINKCACQKKKKSSSYVRWSIEPSSSQLSCRKKIKCQSLKVLVLFLQQRLIVFSFSFSSRTPLGSPQGEEAIHHKTTFHLFFSSVIFFFARSHNLFMSRNTVELNYNDMLGYSLTIFHFDADKRWPRPSIHSSQRKRKRGRP